MSEASRKWEKAHPERVKESRKKYRDTHKQQLKEGRKRWDRLNRDKVLAQRRRYRQRHPSRVRAQDLRKSHFTLELLEQKLKEQRGGCMICGTKLIRGRGPTSMTADHDHKTKMPRGVLCRRCNTVIGFMDDDPGLLTSAAFYLESFI